MRNAEEENHMANINPENPKYLEADSWLVVSVTGALIIGAIAGLILWALESAYVFH